MVCRTAKIIRRAQRSKRKKKHSQTNRCQDEKRPTDTNDGRTVVMREGDWSSLCAAAIKHARQIPTAKRDPDPRPLLLLTNDHDSATMLNSRTSLHDAPSTEGGLCDYGKISRCLSEVEGVKDSTWRAPMTRCVLAYSVSIGH